MNKKEIANEIVDLLISKDLTVNEMSDILFDAREMIKNIVISQPVTFRQEVTKNS